MGFSNSSCSFTRFRVIDPVTAAVITEIPQKLSQFAFRDIEELPEMQGYGWVCLDDMLDSQWDAAPPFKGEFAVFSLRLDTRRIPAGVIKKHLALAIKQEITPEKKFISRERKKELREQVLLKLRQRFLPVPAEFNVIWELQTGQVWFASVQTKMLDLFQEYFLNTFDLHLEQLTPYNLATAILGETQIGELDSIQATQFTSGTPDNDSQPVDAILGEEFLTWLWYQSDTAPDFFRDKQNRQFNVYMEQRIVVQGGQGQQRETATVSGSLSHLREARYGLGTGKKVARALIRLEQETLVFQFTLKAEDFSIGSLKTPKLDATDRDDDPDALFLEKIFLYQTCLDLLDSLYLNFLNLRLSASWGREVADIGQWLARIEPE